MGVAFCNVIRIIAPFVRRSLEKRSAGSLTPLIRAAFCRFPSLRWLTAARYNQLLVRIFQLQMLKVYVDPWIPCTQYFVDPIMTCHVGLVRAKNAHSFAFYMSIFTKYRSELVMYFKIMLQIQSSMSLLWCFIIVVVKKSFHHRHLTSCAALNISIYSDSYMSQWHLRNANKWNIVTTLLGL